MGTAADGGPGRGPISSSEEVDAIDAGWDDDPAATPPVSSGSPAVQAARTGAASVAPSSAPARSVTSTAPHTLERAADDGGTLRPSAVKAKKPAPQSRSLAQPVMMVAIAASIALGSVVALQRSEHRGPRAAAEPPSQRAPAATMQTTSEPVQPTPVPAATATEPKTEEPASEPAKTSGAPGLTEVTVKSFPAGAMFFENGKRLGSDSVNVSVQGRSKRHLTALLKGYRPMNFVVDGSRSEITLMLKPLAAAPGEPTPAGKGSTAGSTQSAQ